MKSKKLIVFLIVLAFLTVLIVLNSTLFTLQKINVNWLTTKYYLENVKDYNIVEKIETGESIFLIKKNEIAKTLEKEYPYLRVVSIETKFPNKIVIHSAERETMFAVCLSDNEYAIVDELGKVLNLSDSSIFVGSELGAKPIKVYLHGIPLNPQDYVVGEEIKNKNVIDLLVQISKSLRESNYIPTTSKGVFTSIDITAKGESSEIFFKTRNGLSIVLQDAMESTTDKFLLGLERYNYFHQEGVVEGSVIVWYNSLNEQITARYEKDYLEN